MTGKIIVGLIALFFLLVALGSCKVSSRCSRWEEERRDK